jgi:NAD-dependent DNA ligase
MMKGELREFLERIGNVDYVTELKMDGLSMAADSWGTFAQAVTRARAVGVRM